MSINVFPPASGSTFTYTAGTGLTLSGTIFSLNTTTATAALGLGSLAFLNDVDTSEIINGAVTTPKLGDNAVTNAKAAQMAAGTLKGNNTGATANASDLTATQVKTMLAIASGDVSGLGALATASSVNLTSQATGTLQAAQAPALSGDVTSTAGSLSTTIANGAVGNAKLATMAANTVKANATNGTASPTDVAIGASQLFGRGATGDLTAITLGTNLSMSGTTLNATGGGGGSPGGSTNQVQFNNGGAFAGAANVEIEGNELRLKNVTAPTAPAAGGVKVYSVSGPNWSTPGWMNETGYFKAAQANFATSSVHGWKASANSTTVVTVGTAGPSATGTVTARAISTTNLLTYTPGVDYRVTTAATTAVAGWRGTTGIVTIGGPSAALGGFDFNTRWYPSHGVSTATTRAFVGLSTSLAAPTDVEPSSLTNQIGMGWDAADTNVQIMHNDASGVCTKIDLGSSFPVPTTDSGVFYELVMHSPKGTTQIVHWRVTEKLSGVTASGSVNTNIPGTTNLLAARGWMSVGGTSSVIGIGLVSAFVDPNTEW